MTETLKTEFIIDNRNLLNMHTSESIYMVVTMSETLYKICLWENKSYKSLLSSPKKSSNVFITNSFVAVAFSAVYIFSFELGLFSGPTKKVWSSPRGSTALFPNHFFIDALKWQKVRFVSVKTFSVKSALKTISTLNFFQYQSSTAFKCNYLWWWGKYFIMKSMMIEMSFSVKALSRFFFQSLK